MPRAYRSDLRGSQAEETRRRVLQVAAELFARDGYASTSVRQLATAAGVSVNTLYAIGGKTELFRQALALVMDDNPENALLVDHPDLLAAFEDPTPERVLTVSAELVVGANARGAQLWAAFEEGARGDADLAAAYEQENANMRRLVRKGLVRMIDSGVCPPQANLDRTADLIWAANHPATYNLLVRQAGWAHKDFQQC